MRRSLLLRFILVLPLLAAPLLLRGALDERVLRAVWRVKVGLPLVPRQDERLQTSLYDCGPAVLAEALRQRGRLVPSRDIEALAGTTVRGTTMLGLQRAATALGVSTAGMMLSFDDLRRASLPAIVFVRGNHFVLVTAADRGHVTVLDPAVGRLQVGRAQFLREWRGETLVFDGTPSSN